MPPPDVLLPLRTCTAILVSTPEDQLSEHVPALVSVLYSTPLLDTAFAQSTSENRVRAEEATLLCNKFKTRISALLQSRTQKARWCAVVLAKCSFESSAEAQAQWGGVWIRLLMPLISVHCLLLHPRPRRSLIE